MESRRADVRIESDTAYRLAVLVPCECKKVVPACVVVHENLSVCRVGLDWS